MNAEHYPEEEEESSEKKRTIGLRARLAFLFGLVLVVVTLTFGFVFQALWQNKTEEDAKERLYAVAYSRKVALEQFIEGMFDKTRLIARQRDIKEELQNLPLQKNKQSVGLRLQDYLMENMDAVRDIHCVSVHDLDGKMLINCCSDNKCGTEKTNPIDRPIGVRPLLDGPLVMKDNLLLCRIVMPVTNTANKVTVGFIVISFSANDLVDILKERSGLGKTGRTELGLKDSDSVISYYYDDRFEQVVMRVENDSHENHAKYFRLAFSSGTGYIKGMDSGDIDAVGVAIALDSAPWAILIRMDGQELFDLGHEAQGVIIFFALFLIFLGMLIARIFGSGVLHQIDLLRGGLQQLHAKGPTADFHVPIHGSGELADMARELNSMVAALLDSRNKLSEQGDFFRLLINTVPSPIFYKDANGRYMGCNSSFEQALGLKQEDIIGKTVYEISPSKYSSIYHEKDLSLIRSGGRQEYEAEVEFKDGSVHLISFKKAVFYEKKGNIGGIVGVMLDITDLKRNENKIRQTASALQATLDATSDGILTVSVSGVITAWNKRFFEVWGVSDDILPENRSEEELLERMLPLTDNPQKEEHLIYEIYARPNQNSLDRVQLKNGILLERESIPQISHGEVIGRVWCFTDITEREYSIRKLRENEEQTRMLVENIPQALYIVDPDGFYRACNSNYMRELGADSPDEIIGKNISHFFSPEKTESKLQKYRKILETRTPVEETEKIIRKNSERYIHIVKLPIYDNDEGVGVLTIRDDITRYKQMENQLIEHREHLQDMVRERTKELEDSRRLIQSSSDFIGMADLNGTITHLNRAGLSLVGLKDESEALGRHISEFAPDDNKQIIQEQVMPTLMRGEHWRNEGLLQHFKTGEKIPVFMDVFLMRDPESGRPLWIGAVMRDIREYQVLQERIRESEAALKSMFHAILDPAFMLTTSGEILLANQAVANLFGKNPDELTGANALLILPDNKLRKQRERHLQQLLETGEAVRFEDRQNGRVFDNNLYPVKDENGKVWAVTGLARDITEDRIIQRKVFEQQERFRLYIKMVQTMIVVLNDKAEISVINPHGCDLLGWREEELLGKNWIEMCIPTEQREMVWDVYKQIINGKIEMLQYVESNVITKDGRELFIAWGNDVLRDNNGSIIGTISSGLDITERKIVEDQLQEQKVKLEESNRELEHFAYVASHDLQEPLRTIGNYVQLLERRYFEQLDERGKKYMHYIIDATRRQRSLIQDLLEFSRIDRMGDDFKMRNLKSVIETVLEDMSQSIDEKNVEVIVEGDFPDLPVDQSQISQVFQNIISNGIKYQKSGNRPVIHIQAKKSEKDKWLFSVRDNGIGINEKHFDRIFALFQRLHTREQYSGTGLGLAMCRKIIERHGGNIWLESKEGRGTTFFFTLSEHPEDIDGTPE